MEPEQNSATYLIIKDLGDGYHSTVKLGVDQNGNKVAIKKYKSTTSQIETMLDQARILQSLDHPNIVKVLDWKQKAVLTHRNGQTQNCWAMITEYYQGGQLFNILNFTGAFSQKIARTYFLQILNALNYMHQAGYTHRDLKPQNIILSDKFQLKIVDFGFSCTRAGPNGTGILSRDVGSKGYKAPQILKGIYDGAKVDIFATGVILFIMYAGRPPFQFPTENDPFYRFIIDKRFKKFWKLYQRFYDREYGSGYFNKDFQDLINRMIAFKQSQRITIPQILIHPWVLGPTATSSQIYQNLQQRKVKVQQKLAQMREQQGRMEEQYVNVALNQRVFSNIRGPGDLSKELLSLVRQEMNIQRQLSKFEEMYREDIILENSNKAYAIARIKHIFKNLEIDLSSAPFQPIKYAIVPRDSLLHFHKIQDRNKNQIEAEFQYMIETDDEDLEHKVSLKVIIGKDIDDRVVFRLVKKEGDEYAFRRILNEVKNTFAYAAANV